MSKQQDYYKYITTSMKTIIYKEMEPIEKAAEVMNECVNHNHRIFFFGTGHSYLIVQDVFARAGGYGYFHPILEDELGMNHAYKSTYIERNPHYADVIMALYDFQKDDVIVMISNSGRNALIIELTLRLKQLGMHIICITALDESKSSTSRHPSGYKLYELSDIILDNHSPYGDALIRHNDSISTGPTSTIMSSYLIQLLVTEFVSKQLKDHDDVSVYRSSNIDGGDAYNQKIFDQYKK